MAAREFARRNAKVLLVDRARFPRVQGLWRMSQSAFASLSSQSRTWSLDRIARRDSVDIAASGAGGRFADVALPTGAGISREAFDAALVNAAMDAGAAFLTGTASLLHPNAALHCHHLRIRQSETEVHARARVVLAAGGLGSKLNEENILAARTWDPGSRVGAGVMIPEPVGGYEPGVIYMACSNAGYVGQVLVEDGKLDIAAALDPVAVKAAGGPARCRHKSSRNPGCPRIPVSRTYRGRVRRT